MEITVTLNTAGDAVEAVVLLPAGVKSAADVSVEVLGENILLVECTSGEAAKVALPAPVDPDTGRVRFRRAAGKLTFTANRISTAAGPSSDTTAPRLSDPSTAPSSPASQPANGSTSTNWRTTGMVTGPTCTSTFACTGTDTRTAAPSATIHNHPHTRRQTVVGSSSSSEGGLAANLPVHAAPNTVGGRNRHEGPDTGAALPTQGAAASPPASVPAASAGVVAAASEARDAAGPSALATAAAADGRAGEGPVTTFSAPPSATAGSSCSPPPAMSATGLSSNGDGSSNSGNSGSSHHRHLHPPEGEGANDDAELYADFYCNSPPAVRAGLNTTFKGAAPPPPSPSPPPPAPAAAPEAEAATDGLAGPHVDCDAIGGGGGGGAKASVNAAKVTAAFEDTGGTSSRTAGFSFTAPDLPPPPPLPAGLPPVAAPIDCRYLAVSNALRVSAHAGTAALAEMLGLRRRPSAAAERRKTEKVEQIVQRVADTLDAYGYAVLDNYISEAAIHAARKELQVMEQHYSPGMIWVGKEAEAGAQISVSSVRGDVVLWLDDQALNATAFLKDGVRRACSFMQLQQLLADVDELVFEGLRPRLPYLAGLHRRSDAMMAVYPGKGARFAKHVDNTTMDGRRLTVLTYLNPGWQEQQGGALRLSPVREGAAGVVDVLPVAGRVALFLSAEVAHEVMPAFAQRHAVTLWYFDAGEHAAALTAAKVLPGASSRPSAQAAATALLRDLLADEASSGIEATSEGCAALGTRVAALEPGAQQLLAAVLGLPSTRALVESMRGLTPDSLRQRREELRNMGLGTQHHAPDTTSHVG